MEDAGITRNDYSNSGTPFEKDLKSKYRAKSMDSSPDGDDLERKEHEKAKKNLKAFGEIPEVLRMKKMNKK